MFLRTILVLIVLGLSILCLPRIVTGLNARGRIYAAPGRTPGASAAIPARRAAIVFGAGLWPDGSATPVLRDRVATAAQLYLAGKVEKLLMSGDNRFLDYNEPGVMRQVALEMGVPQEDIVLDYAGQRTYDTCFRASAIFGLKEAILVTQSFHLPRAIFLCGHLGVEAIGVAADIQDYRKSSMLYWNLRELISTIAALWDLYVSHPVPVLGDPQPMFP